MTLREELKHRIVVKDGAIGTMLEGTSAGRGVPFFEALNIKDPRPVLDLHRAYLDAGADVLTTNSFSCHPVALAEWKMEDRAVELNRRAAELARKAVRSSRRKAWVAGSMGPTPASLLLRKGAATFEILKEGYQLQARALLEGGADFLLLETLHDPLNAKAGLAAAAELRAQGVSLEIAVSMSVGLTGLNLAGQGVDSFVVSCAFMDPVYLGLNCSLGPEHLRGAMGELSSESPCPTALVPNAGLPDSKGRYALTPDRFVRRMRVYLERGQVNLVGGCCGTTPEHIRRLVRLAREFSPRKARGSVAGKIAGLEACPIAQAPPPLLVGERANTLGSRAIKGMVEARDSGRVLEVLKAQSALGAHALDIGLALPGVSEEETWRDLAPGFAGVVRLPVFIDTTRVEAAREALCLLPGKPVINSVNLEDGGRKLEEFARLLRRCPAAVVAGLIDENGMAKTLDEKMRVAEKLYRKLTALGIPPGDILFDPLVFPLITDTPPGETLKGVRALKKEYPESFTAMGVSNISFGLPPALRRIFNALYLHMAVREGLDAAIVNIGEMVNLETVEGDVRAQAEEVLQAYDLKALARLTRRFANQKAEPEKPAARMGHEDHLRQAILEGLSGGIESDVQVLLRTQAAARILNGPMLGAMGEVGRRFGQGTMIVSEVLLSAEVFRKTMEVLAPSLEESSRTGGGKVVLATVKGDVHDIGKNLVGMILRAHGIGVVDLGTQVPAEVLLEAVKREKPAAVGLSGLLLRSTLKMKEAVEGFQAAGLKIPVIVGGAALTEAFTSGEIAPAYPSGIVRYAKDCMEGLGLFRSVLEHDLKPAKKTPAKRTAPKAAYPSRRIPRPGGPHPAPDFRRHKLDALPIKDILPLLDFKRIYSKHLRARGENLDKARTHVNEALRELLKMRAFKPKGVFRFFNALEKKDRILLLNRTWKKQAELTFVRSGTGEGASDWISADRASRDSMALMVVTAGDVKPCSAMLRDSGHLFLSYAVEAIALELAEAAAEYVHRLLLKEWGFGDDARSIRLSPGYSACPDLSLQKTIFHLMTPGPIGVRLTEEFMMDPEASVSAFVFHP